MARTYLKKATKTAQTDSGDVSEVVQGLSEEVKQASLDTSSQVSTIAAATEQMTANNESVSDRALAVTNLSSESKDASNRAKDIVEESNVEVVTLKTDLTHTSSSLSNLADKCEQIDNLMSSIKAISEQTNLLALNAAIESARAGEHGRGFAVVADEVRQLAMRTKDNTEQISGITASLISESKLSVESMQLSLSRSENVSNSSNSAKTIIDTVVESISSVSENMMSVSNAIKEQSMASSEISKSTCQLEDTSRLLSNNATATERSFLDLKNQIDQLSTQLTRFK
jgi:methyl-accepting chemotaxis protein